MPFERELPIHPASFSSLTTKGASLSYSDFRNPAMGTLYLVNESADQSFPDDQSSGVGRYDKRIEELVEGLATQVERAGGRALDELAAAAKSFAERLEQVAQKAREKREKEGAETPPPADGPSDVDEPATDT